MATILLIDAQTGFLLSVMEGGLITDLRTGAATAIAAKYLARKDARIVAMIGAGVQGRMQVSGLSHVFSLSEIRVADVMADARTAFVQDMGKELGIPIRETADNEEAVRGADIVITATTSDQVLVHNDWVARGAFVASLGSYPELDPRLILSSDKLVVDSWAQNMHRGELSRLVLEGRITEKDIHAEMGQIVHGSKSARESNDETIVACLIGLGTHDIACAHFVYQEAKKKKLGRTFSFCTFG